MFQAVYRAGLVPCLVLKRSVCVIMGSEHDWGGHAGPQSRTAGLLNTPDLSEYLRVLQNPGTAKPFKLID